ncbi:MAG: hypothetical protein NXI22_01070 [bacterium]|nr:hypothetical protein [bacterium]
MVTSFPQLRMFGWMAAVLAHATFLGLLSGCGTTKSNLATEQLLMSDAVDYSVSRMNFDPLSGRKVFLETRYLTTDAKISTVVGADYVASSLRQQIAAAGCLLQDTEKTADYIIEARLGALGTDSHVMTYGVPASTAVSSTADIFTNGPEVPAFPEIAFAKRSDESAAAKIVCFAYERESRIPVWQSGVKTAKSDAKGTYVLGAGPFREGSIYDPNKYTNTDANLFGDTEIKDRKEGNLPEVDYSRAALFSRPLEIGNSGVMQASFEEVINESMKTAKPIGESAAAKEAEKDAAASEKEPAAK